MLGSRYTIPQRLTVAGDATERSCTSNIMVMFCKQNIDAENYTDCYLKRQNIAGELFSIIHFSLLNHNWPHLWCDHHMRSHKRVADHCPLTSVNLIISPLLRHSFLLSSSTVFMFSIHTASTGPSNMNQRLSSSLALAPTRIRVDRMPSVLGNKTTTTMMTIFCTRWNQLGFSLPNHPNWKYPAPLCMLICKSKDEKMLGNYIVSGVWKSIFHWVKQSTDLTYDTVIPCLVKKIPRLWNITLY